MGGERGVYLAQGPDSSSQNLSVYKTGHNDRFDTLDEAKR